MGSTLKRKSSGASRRRKTSASPRMNGSDCPPWPVFNTLLSRSAPRISGSYWRAARELPITTTSAVTPRPQFTSIPGIVVGGMPKNIRSRP
jgi:hypothetical protein